MPGVSKDFAEHKLHVRPDTKPVRQPLRRLSEEKRRVVGEEIARLLAAGFIMEVFFPEWLANPVVVLKKNKQWRMCIDYTGLNKACPKDPFALPRIDQVIDSTAGCECRISGSGRPSRFELWGARGDHTYSLPVSRHLARI